MKRIRFLSWTLSLCLLFSATACNRMEDPDLPSETESVSGPREPDKHGVWYMEDLIALDRGFSVEGLYGKPSETLKRTDQPASYQNAIGGALDTGAEIYLTLNHSLMALPIVYNKSAGTFSLACVDPLCEHDSENCIWNGSSIFPGGDKLIFVMHNDTPESSWEGLYVCDLTGSDPQKVYENNGEGMINFKARSGDYLFFSEGRFDPEQGDTYVHYPLLRIPIDGGDAEIVMEDTSYHQYLAFDEGRKLLDVDPEDENCYIYDIKTEKRTLFGSGIIPYAVYEGWIYYIAEDGLYRALEPQPDWNMKVLGNEAYSRWDTRFSGYRMYYLHKTVFSESETYGTYYQYELYSAGLNGGDRQLIRTFEGDDGIPVRVHDFWTDGKLLLVNYEQYWNFKNEFNPKFSGTAASSSRPTTYALIDLSTGEQVLFSSDYRNMLAHFYQS